MENTFGKNIIPENEKERMKAVNYYDVLGDLPDRYFSNLAHIIAATFDTPIALVTFVKNETVEYKANFGMESIKSVDRGISLCSLAIMENDTTVFSDAIKEPCLLGNPLVAGDFGLRFYAGAPLVTNEGFNIGTVCVVGKEPRVFTVDETKILQRFAENVMLELEMRKELHSLQEQALLSSRANNSN